MAGTQVYMVKNLAPADLDPHFQTDPDPREPKQCGSGSRTLVLATEKSKKEKTTAKVVVLRGKRLRKYASSCQLVHATYCICLLFSNLFLHMSSLPQEWADNKKALLEFAWATHMGIKGMVCRHPFYLENRWRGFQTCDHV
jgi:hypothetical protein